MMADFTEDIPEDPPMHESTGLGQTESDSYNLHLSDSLDGSSFGPPGNDTPSAQSKPDEGGQKSFSFSSQRGSRRGSSDQDDASEADERIPTSFNFRKPRSRKTSTRTPTSSRHSSPASSAASSRRPSRSGSSSRRRSSTQDSLSEAMNSECFSSDVLFNRLLTFYFSVF